MPQQSGPITGINFTDGLWRDLFGDEPAIVGDVNGTAYQITTPTSTDQVLIGSPSQDSIARVGGFAHKIPAGQTEPLTVPPSTDSSVGRTDLIVCRYDPTWGAQEPGPVRLHRIPGVEGSNARPAYDGGPPGIEDLAHYAITRKKGQALNQAAVVDLRSRTGPSLLLTKDADLPANVPLGTRVRRGRAEHMRMLDASGTPYWDAALPAVGPAYASYSVGTARISDRGTWLTLDIPDPGYPYLLEATAQGEWVQSSGRHDFGIVYGSATGGTLAFLVGLPTGTGFKVVRTRVPQGPSLNTPFTGPTKLFAIAYKVGNGTALGNFTQYNASLLARVIPA
ncbi:hypothetical protein NSA53_19890 [Cellulosimicrobium cellulans]|uniref:hypothetical protein n=1 Tax=Cellulosimicrobium cellulans TaxID=1710 RepID=UPI00214A5A06|nr:hypothetical protein [Cellulosimicrobium cellulans]